MVEALGAAGLMKVMGKPISFPVVAYAGYLERVTPRGKITKGTLIAYGGLAWRYAHTETGQACCEMWFEIAEPRLMRTLTLVRWARRMLLTARQLGESAVFCVRDDERPQSEKLLSIVGMELDPTGKTFGDGVERHGEVWIWLASRDSARH